MIAKTTTEYRLRVRIVEDLASGLRKGDDFEPLDPVSDPSVLWFPEAWWRSHGHETFIESRTVTRTFSPWKEATDGR